LIYLAVGVPGSGKSTWAKSWIQKNPNTLRLCRDDLRAMLGNAPFLDPRGEKIVTKMIEQAIANKGDKDLVIDQTNCSVEFLKKLIKFCTAFDEVTFQVFDVPTATCIQRDAVRDKKVGPEIINRMAKGLVAVKTTFDLNKVIPKRTSIEREAVAECENKQAACIFDIDGTLALMNGRSPFNWNKVGTDLSNEPVVEALLAHKAAGHVIIIMTGRDGICKDETLDWLETNRISYDLFFMRELKDNRKDTIIKKELYEIYIKPKYHVVGVYDDRKSVKRMWVEEGLFVFDCNQTDEEF